MAACSRDESADQAGVEPPFVDRLVELGIVKPNPPGRFSTGDVRRILMAKSVEDAGISLDGLGAAMRNGSLSWDFFDAQSYDRFASLVPETFRQASVRTGVPIELLTMIREAIGMAPPEPDDQLREDELAVVSFVELQVREGFRHAAIERLLRVCGDSTRRIAEQEGAWWRSEVIEPALAAGKSGEEIGNAALANQTSVRGEQALLAMYHAQQSRAWTANFIESIELMLSAAGLHSRLERPPAVCFLDITGYTRLTQERGDEAAAHLAATVARLVQRSSVQHGGKPIKWLGDGVMLLFREPARGVASALEMVDLLSVAGLPPAHVGLHCGPVLFQEGDYYGQTVNVSARIGEYARPGEVLVSQAVVDASAPDGVIFRDIGAVELRGVAGPMHLLRAVRAGSA
jgi:adenylate cyclase